MELLWPYGVITFTSVFVVCGVVSLSSHVCLLCDDVLLMSVLESTAAVCYSALLVGHHAGDQAETIAMRLGKGSGLAGLAGAAGLATTSGLRFGGALGAGLAGLAGAAGLATISGLRLGGAEAGAAADWLGVLGAFFSDRI